MASNVALDFGSVAQRGGDDVLERDRQRLGSRVVDRLQQDLRADVEVGVVHDLLELVAGFAKRVAGADDV
ncbi:MAG: hypothetical protein QM783_08360 [Phycisphaerales bacterium]